MSQSGFLVECHMRRLNRVCSAVFCVVCFFWVVFSFCNVSVRDLSSVMYFPA